MLDREQVPYQQASVAKPEQPALPPNAPQSGLDDLHPIPDNALQWQAHQFRKLTLVNLH